MKHAGQGQGNFLSLRLPWRLDASASGWGEGAEGFGLGSRGDRFGLGSCSCRVGLGSRGCWASLLGLLLSLFGLGGLVPLAQAESVPSPLVRAYQREFAFLQAQKSALQKRLRQLKKREQQRVGEAQRRLKALQGRIFWLQGQAEKLQNTLRSAERASQRVEDEEDRLQKTLEQARFTLEQTGLVPAKKGQKKTTKGKKLSRAQKLAGVLKYAEKLLERQRSFRRRQGTFYLPDGSKTQGTILQIGRIASYGLSPGGKGALAPAGGGRLKLWPQSAAQTAQALSQGQRPSALKIFLYESLQKEAAWKAEKSIWEFVESGGLIGWVIAGLGGLALVMVLLRLFLLSLSSLRSRGLVSRLEPLVSQGKISEALDLCQRRRGPLARVLQKALHALQQRRGRAEEEVSEAILEETPAIERFGTVIAVCAAVAPLLGLLGTVTGMISTFQVITDHGTGDPKLLAGGISEALVTTKLGLIVAIPTLFAGTLLSGRAETFLARIEWSALRLLNLAVSSPEAASPHSPEATSPQDRALAPAGVPSHPPADPAVKDTSDALEQARLVHTNPKLVPLRR